VQSAFDLTKIDRMPYVEVLHVHVGANPALAKAAVDLGAEGLVTNGSGAGNTGAYKNELIRLMQKGIFVVRSTRVGEGRVLAGGNTHAEGMIAADNLNAQKSALLLSLALTQTRDGAAIQRIFDEY
jgi:L-asparaginase